MSDDWIKMRTALRRHPKTVRIMSALQADRLRVIGAMFAVWSVFDEQSADGVLPGYTFDTMDIEIGWPGFGAGMAAVGWLEETPEGLVMPRSDEHNGKSAKRRAQDADRKKSVRSLSASDADDLRTRERVEKEKEKDKSTKKGATDVAPAPASKKRSKKAEGETYREWALSLKGADMLTLADPIFASFPDIDTEWIFYAWDEFEKRHDGRDDKRQKDWRATFRDYVRKGWLDIWRTGKDGESYLTETGHHWRRHAERVAAEGKGNG